MNSGALSFFKYVLVGGFSTGLNLVLFFLLYQWWHVPYLLAAALSFILSTLAHYFLGVRFVFQSGARFGQRGEIFWVFVVSLIGLALNQAVLFALVAWLRWNALVAQVVSLVAIFAWNYLARRYFVFKSARAGSPPEST